MRRDVAKELVHAAMTVINGTGDLDAAISAVEDPELHRAFSRALASVYDQLYAGIILVVLKTYPDLDPDKPLERGADES